MRALCLIALAFLALPLVGCGGGGSEDPFERLEGAWSGTYTTSTDPFEIRMEVGADGEIVSFAELGGAPSTTGEVEHDEGASYRLELDDGRSIRIHIHTSEQAFLMVYQVAGETLVGLMEKGDVDRPAGGFAIDDLTSSSWIGNGARYSNGLTLTRAFGADLGFGATGIMGGTEGINAFDSAGAAASLADPIHGLGSVPVDGLYDEASTALLLMSPSKRFLLLGACERTLGSPPLASCHFMVFQNVSL